MGSTKQSSSYRFSPTDNRRLAKLCGKFDENLRLLEKHFAVTIHNRGNQFFISGASQAITDAGKMLTQLYEKTLNHDYITPEKIHMFLHEAPSQSALEENTPQIQTRQGNIRPKTPNQAAYLQNIMSNDINFGIGPAGTGKTYLAVACAVAALEKDQVNRILLVRPAVEAGERLGFLPGDLSQKVDPYLRPLYDALYEMLGSERVVKFIERNVIEIAPLAYMRGRTLNDSYIILDEAQNTTKEQMKMFLTRIGFGSKVVITGDVTQVDLPHNTLSGLCHALTILKHVKGISFSYFAAKDVVRHPLVQKIVTAYDSEQKQEK